MDKTLQIILAVITLIIGIFACLIGALALIPAFGQWLFPLGGKEQNTPQTVTPLLTEQPNNQPTASENLDSNEWFAYDVFDQILSDERFDRTRWAARLQSGCEVIQEKGWLTFSNSSLDSRTCSLVMTDPRLIKVADLGKLEAQIMISSNHNQQNKIEQVLRFVSENGDWWAACGVFADVEGVVLTFNVYDEKNNRVEILSTISAKQYDTWYTLRLEIDPQSLDFKCFANDELVGEVSPQRIGELKDGHFERDLTMYSTPNSAGTTHVNNVRVYTSSQRSP
jgi:hypothetical protein